MIINRIVAVVALTITGHSLNFGRPDVTGSWLARFVEFVDLTFLHATYATLYLTTHEVEHSVADVYGCRHLHNAAREALSGHATCPAGIGRALAIKCATQGLNVVLVARPDDLLDSTEAALTSQFPKLSFRKVAVDLGNQAGPTEVEAAIRDLPCPQVCFLNAGYVQTGFFNQTLLEKHFANLFCNVGHVVALSHVLINRCCAAWPNVLVNYALIPNLRVVTIPLQGPQRCRHHSCCERCHACSVSARLAVQTAP